MKQLTYNLKKGWLLILIVALQSCGSDDGSTPTPEVEDEELIIDAPSSVLGFDIGNANDASDIRVFFKQGRNTERILEYRVIVSKAASSNTVTIDDVESLAVERFLSYDASVPVDQKLNLTAAVLDMDGDSVRNGIDYSVLIMAVPDTVALEPLLSNRSPDFSLSNAVLKDLYVSSNATNSVELFDGVTGEHLRSFVSNGHGGLNGTQEVIFLEDGNLLVTGIGNSQLLLYDGTTGQYLGNFTSGYTLNQPTKTNIGPDGYLYVSQWSDSQNSIVRFDLETGEFVDEVVDSFWQGMDQAWDSEGNFYAVSWGLGEMRKYDADFQLISSTRTELEGPVNIWIDAFDVLHVIDWTSGNVKKFDTDLNFIEVFFTVNSRIEGYAFDGQKVYICDWSGSKVHIYNRTTGAKISTIVNSTRINEANGIELGPDVRP